MCCSSRLSSVAVYSGCHRAELCDDFFFFKFFRIFQILTDLTDLPLPGYINFSWGGRKNRRQ